MISLKLEWFLLVIIIGVVALFFQIQILRLEDKLNTFGIAIFFNIHLII